MGRPWECVVVGGGAAVSAALVLGRARRRTLVIEWGNPATGRLPQSVGCGSRSTSAGQLYAAGRRELSAYPSVEYRRGAVVEGAARDEELRLVLDDGEEIAPFACCWLRAWTTAHRAPGPRRVWGRTVFQCPFCDGWEMREKRLATLADGDDGVHSALMLRGWSDDVVLLTNGPRSLTPTGDDAYRLPTSASMSVRSRDWTVTTASSLASSSTTVAAWNETVCSSRRHCSSGHGLPKSWAPLANRGP